MKLESPFPLNLKTFSFDINKKTLVAFASDFGPARNGTPWLHRLYDDAADEGITVESYFTGKKEVFALERLEKNADGDLVAYHFKPVEKLAHVETVTIFND